MRKTESCNTYTVSWRWSCGQDINQGWGKHKTHGRTLHFNTQNLDNLHTAMLVFHKQSNQQHCCSEGSSNTVGFCSCRPVYRDFSMYKGHFNSSKHRARHEQIINSKVLFLKRKLILYSAIFYYHGATALVGQGFLIIEDSWLHSDTSHNR